MCIKKYLSHLPFVSSAVLDGIDMSIEGGQSDHYTDFIRELRRLMDSDSSKEYIITASPQCPFPDHFLGKSKMRLYWAPRGGGLPIVGW